MNVEAGTPSSSESNSTASGSTAAPSQPPKPWSGMGYERVPGLANRIIARYLRTQRRNMERFFRARGLLDSAERMRQIRMSRQSMLAKNRMFQKVLDEYAQRTALQPQLSEAAPVVESRRQQVGDVVVPATGRPGTDGARTDVDGSVPVVATESVGTEPVINE